MKKIVVACDSMKGSLTSAEVGRAACEGIHDASPGVEAVAVSVADGGEGSAAVITGAMGGSWVSAEVDDPLRRNVTAHYGIVDISGTKAAVIDMASASGLTLLSPEMRNPLITTTYGTGQLLVHAWEAGCRRFIIGIGGSATNDAGKGMLEALGVRFVDGDGQPLTDGGSSLVRLAAIDRTQARRDILSAEIIVMCDVQNPLCGAQGASRVYAPQKGATSAMVDQLDAALRHFAQVVAASTGRDVADIPGAGAAGGLGAAFLAFTDARLRRGIDTVLDIIDFDRTIAGADLVITGEGRIDRQTLDGKVPLGILRRCQRHGIPVVAIAGSVDDRDMLTKAGFAGIYAIHPQPIPLELAMRPDVAAAHVRATCAHLLA